jgi:hypothetical protein
MFSLGACWRQQGSTPTTGAIEDIFNDRWEYMQDIYAAGVRTGSEFLCGA